MDLINRNEVIDLIKDVNPVFYDTVNYASMLLFLTLKIPSVEAIPVVHGEWIAQDESFTKFMCSICNGKNYGGHENFCPKCGADMRKKV